jgi:hypothetical protein
MTSVHNGLFWIHQEARAGRCELAQIYTQGPSLRRREQVMYSPLKKLAGAAAGFALCTGPTIAAAATTSAHQPVSPLVAVSVYGTKASAQIVCSQGAAGAAAAGAAAAAQGQGSCVLPATDARPPVSEGLAPPAPPPSGAGIPWILVGLDALVLLAGISTLFDDDDDDDDEQVPISPA